MVESALALHEEKGVLGTSWEEIARKADHAIATVYRNFPTVDQLVSTYVSLAFSAMQLPEAEDAPKAYAGAQSLNQRMERLLQEVFGCYERGEPFLTMAYREQHQVPALAAAVARVSTMRAAFVQEALSAGASNPQTLQVVNALVDFPVWKSLKDHGVPKELAKAVATKLVLG
ncbi:MAG: TetR/AcrR family transcriptional regulator [Dehalococcoidia bacterium]|nr:TetR/AcrR family transcriptional regulator [Dehalococcoidia bacterium]